MLSPSQFGILAEPNLGLGNLIDVRRYNITEDAMGGENRTTNTVLYTGIGASVQEATPQEVADFGQRQVKMSHNIWFRRPDIYSTIIQLGDIIIDQTTATYVVAWTMDFHGQSPMVRIAAMFKGYYAQ